MIRFVMAALVALLSACGGGGGGGGDAGTVTPPIAPPSNYADLAGSYKFDFRATVGSDAESVSGTAQVHSDGTVLLSLARYAYNVGGPAQYNDMDRLDASGSLSSRSGGAAVGQVEFNYQLETGRRAADGSWAQGTSTRQGTGTVHISVGARGGAAAIVVSFPDDSVPFAVRSVIIEKETVAAPVPLERLSGFYQASIARNAAAALMTALIQVDAVAGTISGNFGPDCAISGRMWDYDAANAVFRQEWTFSGSACPVQGTGQFMGRVLNEQTISLLASGLGAWRGIEIRALLPVTALPGSFGVIAGSWGQSESGLSAGVTIHPDGMLTLRAAHEGDQTTFVGTLASSGQNYVAQGDVVHALTGADGVLESNQAGTATVTLSPATLGANRALAVTVVSTVVPPTHAAFTARWLPRNPYFFMAPLDQIAGSFASGWVGTPGGPAPYAMFGTSAAARVDPVTGLISGTVGDCTLSGRLFDYDPWSGVFKQEVTLAGPACPVMGSGRMLGTPGSGDRGGAYLSSSGLVSARAATLLLGGRQP